MLSLQLSIGFEKAATPRLALELFSAAFTVQKINHIHNNSVEAEIVDKAEHYLYSSAWVTFN